MQQLRGGCQLCPVGLAKVICQFLVLSGLGLVSTADPPGSVLPNIPFQRGWTSFLVCLVESLQCAGLIAPSWLQQLGTKTTPSTGPGTAVLLLGAQQMSLSLPYFLFLQLFMSHWQFFLHCSGHTGSLGSGFKILLLLFRSDCQWMSYSLPLATPASFAIFVDGLPPLCGWPAAYTSPVCLYAAGLPQMSSSSW
jgi:hypothetical protein